MADTANNGEATGGRLVALPRRRLDDDLNESGEGLASSPTVAVADLLDRTNHLLGQLERDIDHLKADQAKERARIERENEERQQAADRAIDVLKDLAFRAHKIAVHKARTDVLEDALARKVELDMNVSFEELVRRIEEEIKLAKGITGAIRLATIGDLLKQATLRVEYLTKQADAARERFLKETEHELKSEGKEARASYEIGMSVVRRDLKALDIALPPSGLAWEDPRWEHWDGWDPLSGAWRWIRYGTAYRSNLESFRFPALLELPGGRGIAFDVASGPRAPAVDAVRSVIVRLLASIPAGDARFTFIDPVGLGESAAPFLPLGEFQPDLIDERAYTLEDEIEAKLLEVTKHIERVIQEHLRGEYDTIDALHQATGEVVEPYRFMAVFDFPTQLNERARTLLRNVIDNGPRCGVYTIMTTASGAARANGARWKAMLAGLDVVVGTPDGYTLTTEVAGNWLVDLDAPPELSVFDDNRELTLFGKIITTTGESAKAGRNVEVSSARVFDLFGDAMRLRVRDDLPDATRPPDPAVPGTWWGGLSMRGIGVPIGRSGTRDMACLWLDSGVRSGAVIGGEPGSGKSTVLHNAILGLSILYSPLELTLYLVDFSTDGVSGFEAYATEGLPHARVVAIDTDREFGVSVLDGLEREMTRRAMLFAPHGGERAGIEGYRRATDDDLARIVVVVDAIDVLFSVQDRVGDRAAQLLDTLGRQGASYGIHLVVASHLIKDLERLGRHTLDQLRVRVALACSDDESRHLLGAEHGEASAFGQAGEGVLTMVDAGPDQAQTFQGTSIDAHERGLVLRDLRRLADRAGFTRHPQVFEGRAPARLEDSTIRHLGEHPDTQHARLKPRLWLGEPAALGAPVEVTLRRDAGANLLVVGNDDRLGQGLLVAAMTSAALSQGDDLDLRVLDLMPLESGFGELMRALGSVRPIRLYRRRSLQGSLTDVLTIVEKRAASLEFAAKPVLFVINGLGSAAGHLNEGVGDGFDAVRALERIVQEGPEVGVHSIVWSKALASLSHQVGRGTVRAFALRAVMQMSAEDSSMLIDSNYASSLHPNQALLYDEDAGRLTKFRPYVMPAVELIASLATTATPPDREPIRA